MQIIEELEHDGKCVEGEEMNAIFDKLKKEALYAQRALSAEQLFQVHGKALMARELGTLTLPEFMELNHMTVYFMNTDRAYIQRQREEFFKAQNHASSA